MESTGIKFNKLAFTLAEILITLGIIGVVAALTIPTLVNNYQKKQYASQLKKEYTIFNQALIQMAADKGCVGDLKCTGLFDTGATFQTLGDELVKYFNVVKNCGTSTGQGCFSATTNTYYDGSATSGDFFYDNEGKYTFITSDGASFFIQNEPLNCEDDRSTHVLNYMTKVCGWIRIDVNGPKKPNALGRDTFAFWITNGRGPMLYPYGGKDDGYFAPWDSSTPNHCSPGNPQGYNCAGRVMEEGWEMNY